MVEALSRHMEGRAGHDVTTRPASRELSTASPQSLRPKWFEPGSAHEYAAAQDVIGRELAGYVPAHSAACSRGADFRR